MGKSKKGKKSKRSEEEEDPETFHVEVITEARVVATDNSDDEIEFPRDKKKKKERKKVPAKWEYLVKWAGYESDSNSWEPEGNLSGCTRLLQSFWKHVGTDNDDYAIGYVAKAKKEWIQSEKDYFSREFKNIQAELKRQEKQEKEEKRRLKKAKKAKQASSHEAQEPTLVPEQAKVVPERQESLPGSTHELDAAVSSEDDQPLQHSLRVSKRKRRISSSSEEEPLQAFQSRPTKIRKTSNEPIVEPPPPASPTSLFSEPPSEPPSSPEVALIKKVPQRSPAIPHVNKDTPIITPSIPPIKMTSRSSNAQGKIAHMPPSTVPSGGISTKMRLAQGALDPTLPKAVGAVKPSPKPLPPVRSASGSYPNNSLKNIKIPKHPLPISTPNGSAGSPIANETTAPFLNSPSAQSPQLIFGPFGSKAKLGSTSSISFAEPNAPHHRPYAQDNTASPAMVSQAAADAFLQEIMPPGLAAPLLPAPDIPMDVVPPKPVHVKLPTPGRIPKIWKWNGPLHFAPHEDPICNVKIHHLTKDQALKFSIIFDAVEKIEKIEAGCFYDNADVRTNLGLFQIPPQLALMSPEEEKDKSHFLVLVQYMVKNQKVFMMPMKIDGIVVGQILFFPYFFRLHVIGTYGKDVPLEFNQPGNLVAALLPYTLSQEQLKNDLLFPTVEPAPLEPTQEIGRWTQTLRRKPKYQHGLRVLDFSHKLHKYLADRPHSTVHVWHEKDPRKDGHQAPTETSLLLSILEQTRARLVAPNADARFVFVHVGSLRTLHKLPSFAERRSSPFVQFYTYGSHQDVSQSIWGVREIYPWGGIVTFTPFAMHSDPIGIANLIRKINAHPRWTCYILPSALGLLAKLECGNEDPFKVFDSRKLMMDVILEAIAQGDVALLRAPPEKLTPTDSEDAQAEWIANYISFIPPKKQAALKAGITAFLAKHRLSRADNIPRAIAMDEEIRNDMAVMQRQPAFLKEYRRYVVVDSEMTVPKRPLFHQGLEWTSVAKFDFKDEFYPKQTVGSK
ncbi:hypothetical protein GALMADRAFT_233893 [Galerina marginata CBS 339.88]|uniref:Chromo domain-containing protein n=1 Tax=Galerina marginata (strain CBS 339.88) TaxID=685588 RepID=A0A067TPQ9_GALM3|nr:hypothetical protein GALMADRAFT_233893 [Galerina marginata CBS 339.88]